MKVLLLSKKYPFLTALAAFLLGAVIVFTIQKVFADTSVISACVSQNGNIRIVSTGTTCGQNETPLSWNQQGPQGIQGPPGPQGNPGSGTGPAGLPYICDGFCQLYPYASLFQGKDFTNAQINGVNFTGVDIHGIILKGARISSGDFSTANLTGADFSNLFVPVFQDPGLIPNSEGGIANARFLNANLMNSNFSNNTFTFRTTFAQANLQGANFSNTSFKNVDFTGAINGTTANFTNTTWTNTKCPDGTNSDNNGNTCVGHF